MGGTREYLYVENSFGGDVSVVDVAAGKVVDTIQIGQHPDDVISSNAGDMLYMSVLKRHTDPRSNGGVSEPGEVVAIDAASHEIVWRLPVSGMPHHLIISPDDRYLYQPIFNWDYIEVIDTKERASIAKVPVGYGSHGTRLSPDGKRVYVGCMFSDQITVIDCESLQVLKRIPFPEAVRPFSLTRDEKWLFVQLSKLHGFVIVNLETDEIVRQVDLPALTVDLGVLTHPHTVNHGMNITSDDKLLFAAGSAEHYVCVYSLPELEMVAQIPTGKEPNWIIFSKDERMCFVSNRVDDTISFISVKDLKEVDRVRVGDFPQRMTTLLKPG